MAHEDTTAEGILRDFNLARDLRANFESHWQEIALRVVPVDSSIFESHNGTQTKGEKRTTHLFDSTAMIALGRFASILDSLLTPRNQTWHKLRASDPELNKDRTVKLWFDEVTKILFKHRYAPKANFSSQNQQNYHSLGAYGNGSVFIDRLDPVDGRGFRYRNIHLSEIYFRENHQGLIDTAYRYFPLTVRQALQKWGDRVPDSIASKEATSPDSEFFFLHCVRPRRDRDPERRDFRGMPFESFYVSEQGQEIVDEGGFRTFPYATSRYTQASREVYGRSPAMDVLPAIKTLNEEKKTVLKQGHRATDPVILTHDDGVLDEFSLHPGAINYGGVSAEGRPLVHTLPVGNIAIGKDLMDDERAAINDVFLVTLFQILIETPTMTATEVLERTREKGILLAPTVGRQQSEYLGPLIEREIDVAVDQNLLPPIPPLLIEAEGEFEIEYDSPLSRVQRAEEASGLLRSLESTLSIVNATQDAAPLDHYNFDVIIPELNAIHGVPIKWMRSVEDIQKIRDERAQQQQIQTAIQAAPGAAAMTNAATKAAQ